MLVLDKEGFTTPITPTEFEHALWNLIKNNFSNWRMFFIKEERRLYNPYASDYIWEQNKGKREYVCEVYFNGEYLCDVTTKMQPEAAIKLIKHRLYDHILMEQSMNKKVERRLSAKKDGQDREHLGHQKQNPIDL